MSIFSLLEVSGSPYECGRQHGLALSNAIHQNIDNYSKLAHHYLGLNQAMALDKVKPYIKVIQDHDNTLIEEMQGIADGSGTTLEAITLLNARSELLSTVPLKECTTIAVLPPTSDCGVLLAQNWDWYCAFQTTTTLLKITQQEKPNLLMLVEAGQIGKLGINSAGIGLVHNWLETNHHCVGVPFIVLCRSILNNSTLRGAMHDLCRNKRGSSGNFMLAHRGGFGINFETTPESFDYIEPENGLIVHTNHFLSPFLRSKDSGLLEGWDSVVRRQTAERLIKSYQSKVTKEMLQRIQCDTSCGNDAINLSKDTTLPLEEQWATLARVILDLGKLSMFVSFGNSPETQYQEFTL